jgi:hypothetical protein
MNAQLGTDLAQSPALAVQVGSTLNVHGATVNDSQAHSAVCTARWSSYSWTTQSASDIQTGRLNSIARATAFERGPSTE